MELTRPTRYIIMDMAKEYIADSNVKTGFISGEWIDRITQALNLENLSDLELSNMWDMVDLTVRNLYYYYYINGEKDMAFKYLDTVSAFTEVVNREARRRRELKKGKFGY